MGRVDAITFDFWNTLIAEQLGSDHRVARWSAALREHELEVPEETFTEAVTALWVWFQQEWEENRQVTQAAATDHFLAGVGLSGHEAVRAALLQSLHDGFDPAEMTMAPHLADALEALRSAGVRIGIICDVGITPSVTLRRYLEHHGVLGHFNHWSFSDDVGVYKPDPAIYAHAMAGLGVTDPSRMAHIGDLRRTDVTGARAAGWLSLRYTGFNDDTSELPEADLVIDDHLELPVALAR